MDLFCGGADTLNGAKEGLPRKVTVRKDQKQMRIQTKGPWEEGLADSETEKGYVCGTFEESLKPLEDSEQWRKCLALRRERLWGHKDTVRTFYSE